MVPNGRDRAQDGPPTVGEGGRADIGSAAVAAHCPANHLHDGGARRARSREEAPERPRPAKPKTAKPAPAEEPRRQGLDKLLSGEGASEEEYPELADELKGIGDIADLLREGGRENAGASARS